MRPVQLALLLAAAGCATEPAAVDEEAPGFVPLHADDGAAAPTLRIAGLQRLSETGPLFAGEVATFEVHWVGALDPQIAWTADGGEIEADGAIVDWTLPATSHGELTVVLADGGEEPVRGTFRFGIFNPGASEHGGPALPGDGGWVVPAASQGLVDGGDSVGACALGFDSSDSPRIAYTSETHTQLKYAYWSSNTWNLETVDGPGFDVGGSVESWRLDMAVTTAGVPHIVYGYNGDTTVRYAQKSGTTWIREIANGAYPEDVGTSYGYFIALDPTQSNRPLVAWSQDMGTPEEPRLAYRTGTNAWTQAAYSTGGDYDYATGLGINAAGTAWLSYDIYYQQTATWTQGAGFQNPLAANAGTLSYEALVAFDGSGLPILAYGNGMFHRVGSNWVASAWESINAASMTYDLATTSTGAPRMVVRHGGNLELMVPNASNYWTYTTVDSVDQSRLGMALDSAGNPHACYVKNDELWFY
jgi:hypothetical protein